jgi:hypothetical protein
VRLLRRKPGGEEEGHAGKEAGFRQPQQKPHAVEAVRPDHKGVRRRHQAPADHDAGEPAPRAETIEQQIAGDFAGRIGQEENPGGEAKLAGRQPELVVHGQRRETKAGAVEIIEQIGDRQKRHETKRCLANGALQRGLRAGRIKRGIARDALRREGHRLFPSPGRSS